MMHKTFALTKKTMRNDHCDRKTMRSYLTRQSAVFNVAKRNTQYTLQTERCTVYDVHFILYIIYAAGTLAHRVL